jgi:GTP-binding protein Era
MSNSPRAEELAIGRAPEGYRSGFVGILGRPNVGKSTLLNQILSSKVAITSVRPQTTRNAIRGILTTPTAQLVFVDTPGLHKPRTQLGQRLNRVVRSTLGEVDVVLFLVDVAEGIGGGDAFIANEVSASPVPVIVVLNKIDRADPAAIADARRKVERLGPWPVFAVSALTGDGVDDLVDAVVALTPHGPLHYPPESVTDQPAEVLIAELIREKVLEVTREEVPHSVAVVVDEISAPDEKGTMEVSATIYVERDSQKGIVIGKSGRILKDVGTRARAEIEEVLGSHVFLDLRVKVERDWQRRDAKIARFGYGR